VIELSRSEPGARPAARRGDEYRGFRRGTALAVAGGVRGLGVHLEALRSRLAQPRWRTAAAAGAIALWLASVAVRALYVLRWHEPRDFVVTDARELTDLALRLVGGPASQTIFDTIWPPGAAAILAQLMALDPTLKAAVLVQLAASAAIPLLVAHTAYLIGGRGLALMSLALASLHFGYIHAAGFFLSETDFQLAMAVAIWASVAALSVDRRCDGRGARAAATLRFVLGVAVGLCWGLAGAFRPNALPVAAIVGAALAVHGWRRRRWRSGWLLAGGALGLVCALAPLAHRCTTLAGGSFCAVATNGAMNVALGQVDDAAGIEFSDPARPALTTGWYPPGLLQHGYDGMLHVPHTIWDTGGLARWVLARAWQDPERFVLHTLRNVVDIFRVDYWPPDLGDWPRWPAFASGWLFLLAVLLPALASARRLAVQGFRADERSVWPAFLAGVVGAVMLVAAASIGEPRYRFPFDGVFVILAAARYAGLSLGEAAVPPRASPPPATVAGLVAAGAAALALVASIAFVSHPASRHQPRVRDLRAPVDLARAADFARPVAPGTAWDAPGNHLFTCRPVCHELRLPTRAVETAGVVEVSIDDNDAYRLTWYRAGRALGHVDLPREPATPGLRVALALTPAAARAGYDAVGVFPLFGDGAYALGHLRPLDPGQLVAGPPAGPGAR